MVDFSPENRPQRGKSERTESGRTEIQDARLLKKAIRMGWVGGDRFPTHVAKSELVEAVAEREPTLVERATLETHDLLSNPDIRVKIEGVKAVVAMERQNQADELAAQRIEKPEGSVTNQQINIYLPTNGRESTGLMYGTNGNGKH